MGGAWGCMGPIRPAYCEATSWFSRHTTFGNDWHALQDGESTSTLCHHIILGHPGVLLSWFIGWIFLVEKLISFFVEEDSGGVFILVDMSMPSSMEFPRVWIEVVASYKIRDWKTSADIHNLDVILG